MPVIAAEEPSSKFISIADIHFSPYTLCENASSACMIIGELQTHSSAEWHDIFEKYDQKKISTYNLNTNYALLKSTLFQIETRNQQEHPQFILILGDFLAHNFHEQYIKYSGDNTTSGYEAFVKKTLEFLTLEILHTIHNRNIYPMVGNNDTYANNYDVDPNGKFLQDTEKTWKAFFQNKEAMANFIKTFHTGGYYALTIPENKKLKLIILNTVMFSPRIKNKQIDTASKQQLQWLHQQLLAAALQGQRVLLAFHIPPGIDVYASLKNHQLSAPVIELWWPTYQRSFIAEIKQFRNIISSILVGHLHMDTFRLIPDEKSDLPIIFTQAITPKFGNNPGYKLFIYDTTTFQLKNYMTYFYPLNFIKNSNWSQEYNFNAVYQPACLSCELNSGFNNLKLDNKLAAEYLKYYYTDSPTTIAPQDWPYYWCAIRHLTALEYATCVKNVIHH